MFVLCPMSHVFPSICTISYLNSISSKYTPWDAGKVRKQGDITASCTTSTIQTVWRKKEGGIWLVTITILWRLAPGNWIMFNVWPQPRSLFAAEFYRILHLTNHEGASGLVEWSGILDELWFISFRMIYQQLFHWYPWPSQDKHLHFIWSAN